MGGGGGGGGRSYSVKCVFSHYVATGVTLLLEILFKFQSKDIFVRINGILMISSLMVSSKNVKVSQKRCLGTSIESFTGSPPSEQIIVRAKA